MRLGTSLKVGFIAAALLVTAGPATHAENDWYLLRDPTVQRPNWFGGQRNAPSSAKIIKVKPQQQQARPRIVVQPRRIIHQAPVVVGDAPSLPREEPHTFVVTMGDSLGELLGQGLEEAFADTQDIKVVRRAKSDTGLVRADFYDWGKVARELLAGDQKVSVGVMLLGINDRQAIRDGDATLEPLSEKWRERYAARIDEIAAAFAEKRVPLVWVGAPPMQNSRLSADLVTLNDIFRQRIERSGGTYVDLWEAFVDSENRYSASGPDYTGQLSRLRTTDGIHFTKAGSRKAGHFVHVAIKRLIDTGAAPTAIVALPSQDAGIPVPMELRSGGIEEVINRMVGLVPPDQAVPVIPVKPLAGPILQLTAPATAKDGILMTSLAAARGQGPLAQEIARTFAGGALQQPKPGRADEFKWPR
jgi:uncharacterized protein